MSTLVLREASSIQNSGATRNSTTATRATTRKTLYARVRQRLPAPRHRLGRHGGGGPAFSVFSVFGVFGQYGHLLTAFLRMVSSHMEPMMIMKNRISTAEESPYWL